MSTVPAKFQLFAITFLLATPSELHHVWIEQRSDWPTIEAKLRDLGFSDDAIKSAKVNIFDPLTNALRDSFSNIADALSDDLPFYDTGTHPLPTEANIIVSVLRGADGTVAHVNAMNA